MAADREALQAILDAHGQNFLNSFSSISEKRFGDGGRPPSVQEAVTPEDEWTGFESLSTESCMEGRFGLEKPSERNPDIIVFNDTSSRKLSSTGPSRSFMSSKVIKLNHDVIHEDAAQNNDDDLDVTNARNDALLHHLVHTQLLSGSLRADLNLSHAQREKALAGRISELAGSSKLGKGELAVRTDEKNRAAKRIRDGMKSKQKERDKAKLDEAKNLGNYHPTLKKLFAASGSVPSRKRDRGLKMGIGNFSGGVLKLSKDEIAKASGRSRSGRSRVGKHIKKQ